MDQILAVADVILKIGGALVVILIVVLLVYLIRLVLIAKWIVWWVKKTVETAQQNIVSPMSMLWSFFWETKDEFDDDTA